MKLKINESKILEFEMNTSGCSWKELQGFFRLTLEGIEYGFPVEFEDGIIKVEIPAFQKVLHESSRESLFKNKEVIVKGRLDIIANNEAYLSPWKGNIEIEIPISVKISEEKEFSKKEVSIVDPDIKEYVEKSKEKKKSKLMDALSIDVLNIEEKINEEKENLKEEKEEKEEKPKRSKFSSILN